MVTPQRQSHFQTDDPDNLFYPLTTTHARVIECFLRMLHDEKSEHNFLLLKGAPGAGKSSLFRFLRERCCRIFENFDADALQAPNGAIRLPEHANSHPLKFAALDFSAPWKGYDRAADAFFGLMTLRRQLGESGGFQCAIFDFACVQYLLKTGQLTPERLRRLFPLEDRPLVFALADLAREKENPHFENEVFNLIGQHYGKTFTPYMMRRRPESALVREISSMPAHTELLHALPRLLVDEIKAFVQASPKRRRVVFFFDTLERYYSRVNDSRDAPELFEMFWLNRFLKALGHTPNIVVALAGRKNIPYRVSWRESRQKRVAAKFKLTPPDISEAKRFFLSQQIEPDRIAPFIDGFVQNCTQLQPDCLAIFSELFQKEENGEHHQPIEFLQKNAGKYEIVKLFLNSLHREVTLSMLALSAARCFDVAIYLHLDDRLYFQGSEEQFRQITEYAFVEKIAMDGKIFYRFPDSIRRQFQQYGRGLVRETHLILIDYYSSLASKGDDCAASEMIYHRNALKWEKGVLLWIRELEESIAGKRFAYGQMLLSLLGDLKIETSYWKARTHQAQGDFLAALGRTKEAMPWYNRALGRYKRFLKGHPNDRETLRGRAVCLQRLAQFSFGEKDYPSAGKFVNLAIQLCDYLLKLDSNTLFAYTNKASALELLARIHLTQRKLTKTMGKLAEAIETTEAVLNRAPEYVPALANKAGLHRQFARAYTESGDKANAVNHLRQAVEVYQNLLQQEQNSAFTTRFAQALHSLGEQYLAARNFAEARDTVQQSLFAIDAGIESGTPQVDFYLIRIQALALRIKIAMASQEMGAAAQVLEIAIDLCNALTAMFPEDENALLARSAILILAAEHDRLSSRHSDAISHLDTAKKDLKIAVRINPDNAVYAHNLGAVYFGIDHVASLSSAGSPASKALSEAERFFRKAAQKTLERHPFLLHHFQAQIALIRQYMRISEFDKAKLEFKKISGVLTERSPAGGDAPDFAQEQALYLQQRGEIKKFLANYDGAKEDFERALFLLEETENKADDSVQIALAKVIAQLEYGELCCDLARWNDAKEIFGQAIETLREAKFEGENAWFASQLMGVAQTFSAKVYVYYARYREAVQCCESAISQLDQAIALAPQTLHLKANKAIALGQWAEILIWQAEYKQALNIYTDSLALFEEALQIAPKDIELLHNFGAAYLKLGRVYASLYQGENAGEAFNHALHAFNKALELSAAHPVIRNHKIGALLSLGDLHAARESDDGALEYYNAAISELREVIKTAPNHIHALNNKGEALIRLGDLRRSMGEAREAVGNYDAAVEVFGKALQKAPGHDAILNNRANAFQKSAETLYRLNEKKKASVHFQKADRLYAEILSENKHEIHALFNRGICAFKAGLYATRDDEPAAAIQHFQQAGDALASAHQVAPQNPIINYKLADASLAVALHQLEVENFADASRNIERAIELYNKIGGWLHDDQYFIFNRATACLKQGEILARQSQEGQALRSFSQAVQGYDEAADLNPKDDEVRRQKGEALSASGDTQYGFSQYSEAVESYKDAVAEYDLALEISDSNMSHYFKAIALANLAGAYIAVSKTDAAITYYQQSAAVYKHVVSREHDYANAEFNLGLTLANIGNLYFAINEIGEAQKYYQEAVSVYKARLARHPREISTLLNRGLAQTNLAEVLASASLIQESRKSYRAAIETFHEVLSLSPDEISAYYNQGLAFAGLALVLVEHLGAETAIETYKNAVRSYEEALKKDAHHVDALYNKGIACATIAQLYLRLRKREPAREHLSHALELLRQAITLSPHDVQIREAGMQTKTLLQQLGQ